MRRAGGWEIPRVCVAHPLPLHGAVVAVDSAGVYRARVPDSTRRLLVLLVIAVAATRFALVFAHPYSLADHGIYQDDAFYFLQIARNALAGHGLSFDASGPTSGFQPLYQILLLPLVAVSGDGPFLAIRASMALLAAWAIATGGLAFSLGRRLAGPAAGLVALALFAVSPYFIIYSADGQATGLAMFFVLALARVHLWLFEDGVARGNRGAVAYGALIALSVLARVDLAFLAIGLGVDALVRAKDRDAALARVRTLALAAAASFLFWLPWGAYSHGYSGSALPLSGAASREIALNLGWYEMDRIWSDAEAPLVFDPDAVPASFYGDTLTKLGATALMEWPLLSPVRIAVPFAPWSALHLYAPYQLYARYPVALTGVLVLACLGLAALLARYRGRPGLGIAAAVYVALMVVGYGVAVPVHWFYARYLAPTLLLATVVGVAAAARFIQGLPASRRKVAAGVALVAILAGPVRDLGYFRALSFAAEPPASPIPGALARVHDQLPPDAHLGMFQSGAVSWFSGGGVMNLDGKVNTPAHEALREQRLHQYILESGVTHIHAWEFVMSRLVLRHLPREEWRIEVLDRGAHTYDPTLFRVRRN